ncbi:MAG: hypothetical protein ACK5M4_15040 [Pseudorhodobacter sp.]
MFSEETNLKMDTDLSENALIELNTADIDDVSVAGGNPGIAIVGAIIGISIAYHIGKKKGYW